MPKPTLRSNESQSSHLLRFTTVHDTLYIQNMQGRTVMSLKFDSGSNEVVRIGVKAGQHIEINPGVIFIEIPGEFS